MPLGARTLVGRGPACTVRIDDPRVSGEHATLWWADGGWWVRDLGSTNGTFVDGERLAPGVPRSLVAGARCSFGAADRPWQWVEDGPPRVVAESGDRFVAGEVDLLTLPSEDDPRVTVFLGADGWWVEGPDGAGPLSPHGVVGIDGVAWKVHLPDGLAGTARDDARRWSLATVALHFAVSRDEETVALTLRAGGDAIELGARAHHYLLLYLARQRLADGGLPPEEQGWVHREQALRDLGLNELALNVQVHRCRKALAAVDVHGAGDVIERRVGAGQLRLGVASVAVGAG